MNHVKYANKVIYGQYGKLIMKLSRNRVKLVLMTKNMVYSNKDYTA